MKKLREMNVQELTERAKEIRELLTNVLIV